MKNWKSLYTNYHYQGFKIAILHKKLILSWIESFEDPLLFLKLVSDCFCYRIFFLRSAVFKASHCLFWRTERAKGTLLKSVLSDLSWVSGVTHSKHITSLGGMMSEHELSDVSRYQKPIASSTPVKSTSQNGLNLTAFYQVVIFLYRVTF